MHLSAEPDPGDRGRAFGSDQRDAVANTVAVYRRLLSEVCDLSEHAVRDAGRRVGDHIATLWPDLVREVEGIAGGAGVPTETLLAINARTELLAAAGGECSVIASRMGRRCVVAQNWDWHPDLACSLVTWTVRQPHGRWLVTVTEAGMLAKVGLSSAGLCCALNFLRCSADGTLSGVPVHVLLRVLLDRTDTMADALELVLTTPVSASSCITLGYENEQSVALAAAELSPGGCRILRPDANGQLVHTNHFLSEPASGRDLEVIEAPSTLVRLSVLEREEPHAALRSHHGAPESVCRHEAADESWADRRATLASLVIEPGTPRLRMTAGHPCSHPLVDVDLPRAHEHAAH